MCLHFMENFLTENLRCRNVSCCYYRCIMRNVIPESTYSIVAMCLAILLGASCTSTRVRPLQDESYLSTRGKFELYNQASELCMVYSKDDEQTKADVLEILDRKADQFQRSLLNRRRYLAGIYGRKKFKEEESLIFSEGYDEWAKRRNAWVATRGTRQEYATWLAQTRQKAEHWVEQARIMKKNVEVEEQGNRAEGNTAVIPGGGVNLMADPLPQEIHLESLEE